MLWYDTALWYRRDFRGGYPTRRTLATGNEEVIVGVWGLDDRVRSTARSGRRNSKRHSRAPFWLGRMIQEARTIEELDALERPLRAAHEDPMHNDLLLAFTARYRALVTAPLKDRQRTPRSLSNAEVRSVRRLIMRTATHAELDAFVERLRLRYLSNTTRDEVESLARTRRERLSRVRPRGTS